jgi:hypothetical protein
MTRAPADILARLLELTPLPPPGANVDQLVRTIEAIMTARAAVLLATLPPLLLTAAEQPMLVELTRRDAAWQGTLAAALHHVGEQRSATGQLRAYAGSR